MNKSRLGEIVHLFLSLHELDEKGENESEEADRIRDQIDPLWDASTDAEKQIVQLVSESLFQ